MISLAWFQKYNMYYIDVEAIWRWHHRASASLLSQ
jgi:hypothetical protein